MYAQLVDATVSEVLAVFLAPELSDISEGGAHLPPIILIHFSQLVRLGGPELVLSLPFQLVDPRPVVLHSLLTVRNANLKDLVHCHHVVRYRWNPLL